MEQITTFLGWSTLINFVLLMVTFLCLTVFRGPILRLHSAMFKITPEELMPRYLGFMAFYKVLIIFFNLVPYIVLKMIA
ncbi:MAG: hypothetical protein KTR23_05320 [Rhodospirillales bacterium]|nr:hypothetical protein [Rhodospirillales bacterium]